MKALAALNGSMRLGLAGLFVYAGLMKLADPAAFAAAIAGYRLVPDGWAWGLAALLPPLEVVVGAGLLVPAVMRGALLLAAGMLTVFCAALFAAWWRELDVDCGCFGGGKGGQRELMLGVVRNVALVAVIGWLGWHQGSGRIE